MLAHFASHATVTQGDEELKDGVRFFFFQKEEKCEGKPRRITTAYKETCIFITDGATQPMDMIPQPR